MGYYVQTPGHNKGKASIIAEALGGSIVDLESARAAMVEGQGVICVVDNGPFEAAGFAYDMGEFEAFALPDERPRKWVICDRKKAELAANYPQKE